jgi:integrase
LNGESGVDARLRRHAGAASAPAPSLPFEEAFRRWLVVEARHARRTVEVTMKRLRFCLNKGFDVAAFVQSEDGAKGTGGAFLERRVDAGATVHVDNNHAQLRNLLSRCGGHERVHFGRKRRPPPERKALTEDELELVRTYTCRGGRQRIFRRALLCVAFETGLRASELAGLTLSDLDPIGSRIRVARPAKGGQRRWLPMPRWIWSPKRPLGAYLARRPQPVGPDADALWTTERDGWERPCPPRRMSQDYIRTTMWQIGDELGIPLSFNRARHTTASQLRRLGYDLLFIKFWLGHASVKSTEVYVEFTNADVDAHFRRRPSPDPYAKSRMGA